MTGPLVPFREFVLKVHSRCDLACDHCYVYEHADQSWLTRPKVISDEAISWTARRLAEHATTHALPSVTVILHGGEPLLAGPARLRRVCEELGSALNGIAELDLRIRHQRRPAQPPLPRPLRRVPRPGRDLPRRRPRRQRPPPPVRRRTQQPPDGAASGRTAPRGALPPPGPRPALHGRHPQRPGGRARRPRRTRTPARRLPAAARHLGRAAAAPGRIAHRVRRMAPDRLRPLDGTGPPHARPDVRIGALQPERRPQPHRVPGPSPPPTSSSSRPTGRWNRSTRSRARTKAPPPPGSTSSATPSTRSPPTPASG
ncbi:hypothetical protein GA0115255_114332, partial [Streptomyces sp. Ncost-T6T-2b]